MCNRYHKCTLCGYYVECMAEYGHNGVITGGNCMDGLWIYCFNCIDTRWDDMIKDLKKDNRL